MTRQGSFTTSKPPSSRQSARCSLNLHTPTARASLMTSRTRCASRSSASTSSWMISCGPGFLKSIMRQAFRLIRLLTSKWRKIWSRIRCAFWTSATLKRWSTRSRNLSSSNDVQSKARLRSVLRRSRTFERKKCRTAIVGRASTVVTLK